MSSPYQPNLSIYRDLERGDIQPYKRIKQANAAAALGHFIKGGVQLARPYVPELVGGALAGWYGGNRVWDEIPKPIQNQIKENLKDGAIKVHDKGVKELNKAYNRVFASKGDPKQAIQPKHKSAFKKATKQKPPAKKAGESKKNPKEFKKAHKAAKIALVEAGFDPSTIISAHFSTFHKQGRSSKKRISRYSRKALLDARYGEAKAITN